MNYKIIHQIFGGFISFSYLCIMEQNSLIGKKVNYKGRKYIVTDYFDATELLLLDDEITVSKYHSELIWL